MKRLCGLLVISWLAALVCVPLAAAPEIARVTKVPDSDTLLIFGEGFGVPNLQVLCGVTEVVWFPDKDTAQIETIQASGRELPQCAAQPGRTRTRCMRRNCQTARGGCCSATTACTA
jgi:hypothetical protein